MGVKMHLLLRSGDPEGFGLGMKTGLGQVSHQ